MSGPESAARKTKGRKAESEQEHASRFGCRRRSESFNFTARELRVMNIQIGISGVERGDHTCFRTSRPAAARNKPAGVGRHALPLASLRVSPRSALAKPLAPTPT